MSKTIAQRDLRNDNAKVIEAVAAGESFVVTRNGVPVAELRPIRLTRRIFVSTPELLALAAVGPRINREQFRADLDRASWTKACKCRRVYLTPRSSSTGTTR